MNKPIQYKKGYAEFYKLRFKVAPNVLIPRPETELLVDHVLAFISQLQPVACNLQPLTIIDIGTGSGNIAISIAKHLPTLSVGTRVIATDISQKALDIAKQNAKLHGVEKQIIFQKLNLLGLSKSRRSLVFCYNPDIIVTNLPYIPSARIPYLDSSVKDFEPLIALDGGEDGFELYIKLFQQIARFSLPPQGWKPKLIIGEIDYTQAEIAQNEAQKYFPEAKVEVKTDLTQKQRILLIKF